MSAGLAVKNDSRFVTAQADLQRCFKQFRDQRMPLHLTLDEDKSQITARVLDVTAQGVLIEDIKPRDALSKLRKRPSFSLSVRDQGCFAFAEQGRIDSEGEERGLPYFLMPFPERMVFQQRRKAARLRLPSRVSAAGAHVTIFADESKVGKIIDISSGGLRAAFGPEVEVELSVDMVISDCAVNLPPVLEIHSQGIIRHCHRQKDGSLVTGIELTEMHLSDRRRLEQFISSLARHQDAQHA